MILRMTIEVELSEHAERILNYDKEVFEWRLFKEGREITIEEHFLGTIVKVENPDYIMHEIIEK